MKRLISGYQFNAAAHTITFVGMSDLSLDGMLLITNVTDNLMIFNFANPTLTGSVQGNVLTLAYNTSGMSNSDSLQIFYDNGKDQVTDVTGEVDRVAGLVTDKEVLSVLTQISADLSALKDYLLEG
jgi:hypothetical protein